MEFELTEEQRILQQTVRSFAKDHILPGIRERDAQGEFPTRIIKE